MQSSFSGSSDSLFFFLLFPTSMEILHDNSHEHIQDEKTNQKDKGDEIKEAPLGIIDDGLKRNIIITCKDVEKCLTC